MSGKNGIHEVKVRSGVSRIRVSDEHGNEMGIVEFNPGDPNLITRIQKGYKDVKEIIRKTEEDLNRIGYDEDGKELLSNEAFFARVTEADSELKNTLDYMFGTPFSRIFGSTSVMTPTTDGYLLLNILEAILPVVEEEAVKTGRQAEKNYTAFKGRH